MITVGSQSSASGMEQALYLRPDSSQPATSGREKAYFKSDGIQSSDSWSEQNNLGFYASGFHAQNIPHY